MGCVFEYKAMSGQTTSSTDTALGSVILATEYDPTKVAFSSKAQMENYYFAQSTVPSQSVMHGVECAADQTVQKHLYIRDGNTVSPTDLRWSDFGNFYIATQGFPGTSVVAGELWVTYKVKLYKPRLPNTGSSLAGLTIRRTGATAGNFFGTASTVSVGSLPIIALSASAITVSVQPSTKYYVEMRSNGTTTSIGTVLLTGATFVGGNSDTNITNANDNVQFFYILTGSTATSVIISAPSYSAVATTSTLLTIGNADILVN